MEQTPAAAPAPLKSRAELAIESIRTHLAETIKQHRDNLVGWREPDGNLLPTEPDPREREIIRVQLMAAIETLKKVDSHILSVVGGR